MNINTRNEFNHGQVSVTASAAAMAEYQCRNGITLLALDSNTQKVYVGNSSSVSSSTGFPLAAGASILVPVDNMNKIYLKSASGTQTVAFIAS